MTVQEYVDYQTAINVVTLERDKQQRKIDDIDSTYTEREDAQDKIKFLQSTISYLKRIKE